MLEALGALAGAACCGKRDYIEGFGNSMGGGLHCARACVDVMLCLWCVVFQAVVAVKEGAIREQAATIAEQATTIGEQAATIAEQVDAIAQRDETIVAKEATIAELQRQLVSGTRRAQHGGLCAPCAVMCVCTDRVQHGALCCGWCVVQAQARATPVAAAVAAAAPPPPPVADGAAVGVAAAAAGVTPALVRARCAVYRAAVLGDV